MNPRAPLALAATAFSAGILLARFMPRSPQRWGMTVTALLACAFVALARSHVPLARVSAVLALTATGSFAAAYTPVAHIAVPPESFLESDPVEVVGHVINDGALLAGAGPRERFDLETESIQFEKERFTRPVRMRVTMFLRDSSFNAEHPDEDAAEDLPQIFYGERVRFAAKLRLPRNFRNPGAFDYESYLHGLGIAVLSSVGTENLEMLPGRSGSRLGFWRSRIRRSLLDHIRSQERRLWSREDAALFSAMIIGDDSLLLRQVREEFQQTGVYHLLVVSGMNVGLLALAIFWLARALRAPDWMASVVTIVLAVLYAYIAGMGVPIQRAVLMLSLFLIARLFYRGRAALNATGFAALMVLVFSPQALFEAGFQLTFLALLAISGISLPILERTSEPYRRALRHFDSTTYDVNLEPNLAQLRLDLRMVAGRVSRFIGSGLAQYLVVSAVRVVIALYELIVVSVITQATLVMPMRAYFHRAAIIGVPANILALPLAGVMLNSGVAAIVLSYVSMPLAHLAAFVATALLHWTLACLGWLSRLHISQWRVPDPAIVLWLLSAAAIGLAFWSARRELKLAAAGTTVLFICAGVVATYHVSLPLQPRRLEITAIDVSQGDSILIISPQGESMLVDGGGNIGPVHSEFDFGEDVVSPYLWARGLDHLDIVVLSHAHGDHIGGLARVIENFHPHELWLGSNPPTPALKHLCQVAAANHVEVRRHTAGELLDWGGTQVRVLSPPPGWQPKAQPKNDDSLAFLISYRHTSALLAGDVEKKMERFLATESPHADLLKVAHHGSATSTIPEFLSAVQPSFAVISVGHGNSFGHPRGVVLERLQESHVSSYRTDMHGAVTFVLNGDKVEAQTHASN